MIIEALLNIIFGFVSYLITLLPAITQLPSWFNDMCRLLKIGLFFFPYDVWCVLIANFSATTFILLGWSVVEWVYKKIPGVD